VAKGDLTTEEGYGTEGEEKEIGRGVNCCLWR